MEYAFTLKFKLDPETVLDDNDIMARLGNAGCTDALVGLGMSGYVSLEFDRESSSALSAILSAIKDVRRALPKAELVEAGPDFVGLTDIAQLAGVTRQNMRKLFISHAPYFPAPVHGGSTLVWHLSPVLDFMKMKDYEINTAMHEIAFAAMQVNINKETAFLDRGVAERVSRHLHH
jgi:hypothetical protein